MTQIQKYTWLIEAIRRTGKISLEELSSLWENNRDLSDGKPLTRPTFNRWRDAINDQFGIVISCQRTGGYLYYIENPKEFEENELRKWMLDSFAAGNAISENLGLKDRILVENIPSGRQYLTTLLSAMKENKTVNITYRKFGSEDSSTVLVKPYCVKLFESRWYLVAYNDDCEGIRIYGLDRIGGVEISCQTFKIPKDFSAKAYFEPYFGIVTDANAMAERIILRAHDGHQHYLNSLPLHHSQRMLEDYGDYADFELYLVPTYDFVSKIMSAGNWLEVMAPESLRKEVLRWAEGVCKMYKSSES